MASIDIAEAKRSLLTLDGLKAALSGGAGALAGGILGGIFLAPFFNMGLQSRPSLGELLLGQSMLSMVEGAALSAVILAYDNQASLRGRWQRDLWPGVLFFGLVGFLSGGAGQVLYSTIGLTRGLPWALMGAGIGASIGMLRKDKAQAQRGALGGAAGGLAGGLLVDGFLKISYTDASFALASQLGFIITGAMIALLMRVVQHALDESWLLGISSGPYEGKRYPLNTARVTVGQSEANDIGLYRERSLPHQAGAFVARGGAWFWEGAPISINGAPSGQAALQPGDTLQIGSTLFRFQSRPVSSKAQAAPGFATQPALAPSNFPAPLAPSPVPVADARPQVLAVRWALRGASGSTAALPAGTPKVMLGRASGSDIVLGDGSVSSSHARLDVGDVAPDSLFVTDLGSANGTWVNGQKLVAQAPAPLREGDRLKVGALEFTIAKL